MKRFVVSAVLLWILAGCGGPATPTPDVVATQIAVEEAAHATMTARAPAATQTPTTTPSPTYTTIPTKTPTPRPTNTPVPTRTPSPTATWTPSPTPTVEPYETWKQSARTDLTYKVVNKSDQYIGERVCWRGQVFNISESLGVTVLQAWYFEGRSYSILKDGSDAFVVLYPGSLPDVFEETPIEACGLIGEKYEGTNAYGGTIVQPQIRGVYVQKFKPPALPTAKPKTPTPAPILVGIGEQVTAGNWLFTVTEVRYYKALYLYDTAKVAMGVYCVLFIDIQNKASGTTNFGELWWELRDAGGAVFDDDSATFRASWQFGGKDTPWDNLNPGQTAQIVVAFDVAREAKGLQLYSYKLKKPFVLIGDAQPPQDQ
jgi:hypothetical protein